MDPKLRKLLTEAGARNDQITAQQWADIKELYRHGAGAVDAARMYLSNEANVAPVAPKGHAQTAHALYRLLQKMLMQIALVQLQDRVTEWMEAGEIPQGKAE